MIVATKNSCNIRSTELNGLRDEMTIYEQLSFRTPHLSVSAWLLRGQKQQWTHHLRGRNACVIMHARACRQ